MSDDCCHCEAIGNLREIISEQEDEISRLHGRETKRRGEQVERAMDALVNALNMFPSRIEFKAFTVERTGPEWVRPDIGFVNCVADYEAPEDVALAVREALTRYHHREK